jgi:hypothetical protein
MEYSAVLYQHGEFDNLYGPFPQTIQADTGDYSLNFVSFSFLIKNLMIQDSRIKRSGGFTPALMLIVYPKEYDLAFSLCKESISNFLTAVSKNFQSESDISLKDLSMISRKIGTLVSSKLEDLEKPEKILSPDDIFNLPKAIHTTVLAMINVQAGTLEDIAQEAKNDLHTAEKDLKRLIESGYVIKKFIKGKDYYFCSSE